MSESPSCCPSLREVELRLPRAQRRAPHPGRTRHPAPSAPRRGHRCASSLNPGEGFDLVAPHVPTPLLAQIDQLPFTFQHTLLEQSEGFARVEILRTA